MSAETPEWRDVPGWEGFYAVSNDGQVKGLARSVPGRPGVFINKRERLLTPNLNQSGYPVVWLCRNNKRTEWPVHRLVLTAFVGPCPDGMEGCHNNGVRTDNQVGNLRWDTHSANIHDRVRHGNHLFANKTHCPKGHPYDEANTFIARGSRRCRQCAIDYKRAKRRAAKELAA